MRGKEFLVAVADLFLTVIMIRTAPPASAGSYEVILEGGQFAYYEASVPNGFGIVQIFYGVESGILGPLQPPPERAGVLTPYACIYFLQSDATIGCGPISPGGYVADPLLMSATVNNVCVPADVSGSGTLCTTATLTGTGPYMPLRSLDVGLIPVPPPSVFPFVSGSAFLQRFTTAPSGTITNGTAGGAMSGDGYGVLDEGAFGVVAVIAP